jgi:hypothetical protein
MKKKHLVSFIILFYTGTIFCQNIILPEGEFIDTTSTYDSECKGYENVYYYQVGGKYPVSSASLLKDAQTFLAKTAGSYEGTGYITFRFTIDCEGKMRKRVQVLQTDDKYRNLHFDKNLVNDLYLFTQTLDKWNIARSKNETTYFYKAFLTFKIKDGKVINIIP